MLSVKFLSIWIYRYEHTVIKEQLDQGLHWLLLHLHFLDVLLC